MAKLTLNNLANLSNETSAVTTINNNNDAIETALENTLSRDGTSPNSMASDLDLDSNDILNVGNIDVATIDAGTVDADNFTVNGTSLNILLLDWEGDWTDDTAYLVGNLVSRNGSSFICIQAHQSTTLNAPGGPNGDTFWDLVAERGNPGVVETPDTSTVNAVVRYADTLGNSFNDSGVLISDTDDVTGVGDLTLTGDIDASSGSLTLGGDVSLPDAAQISWNSDELTVTQEDLNLVVSSAGQTTLALRSTGGHPSIEIGRVDGSASTPFIDFHSGATLVDYDARIIASNGNGAIGGGDLQITAASVSVGTTAPVTVGSLNIGHASDTTVTRTGAGDLAIEGNGIYRAGGTDIPVADGGSGRSDATAYAVLCGGTTATGAHQSIASVGTSGQVLTSNGAGALPTFQNTATGVVSVVQAGALSAQPTLDISLSTADMYEIDLINVVPATDAQVFHMRFSQSGSFLSGASDYAWGGFFGTNDQDAADDSIQIGGTLLVGNSTNEYIVATIRIYRPSASSFLKTANWFGGAVNSTPNRFQAQGFGTLIANTNAIDGVRFLFNSGNIASGYYAARSYRFT